MAFRPPAASIGLDINAAQRQENCAESWPSFVILCQARVISRRVVPRDTRWVKKVQKVASIPDQSHSV